MIIHEHIQGSAEWHEERHGKIGGTSLKSLMLKKPIETSALFIELLSKNCENFKFDPGYTSDDMQRGIDLEPIARAEANIYTGLNFVEFGWCENTKHPISGCSPDGFTEDMKMGLEIKCPSAKTHTKYLLDNTLPDEYFWQCINYFLVNKDLEKLYFVSYRPENNFKPLFVTTITRDQELLHAKQKATVQAFVEMAESKLECIQPMIDSEVNLLSF